MAQKLTNVTSPSRLPKQLTSNHDKPFVLGFKFPLEVGYTFKELSMRNIKDFQNFLDKINKMTVQEVDMAFGRKPDGNDEYQGKKVRHYGVTDTFRIHVVLDEGLFGLLRLDPNHTFHN